MVVDDHLQRLFSVHVRTDDEDVDLMSYMRSLIALHYHDLPLNQACVTIKDGHYIDLLGGLVFANMADEKGDKMP
jgi:protein XRP2